MSVIQSLSTWSRRALATFLVIGIVVPSVPVANAAKGISGSPRVINLYLDWQLKEEDLPVARALGHHRSRRRSAGAISGTRPKNS
jgi:hypothetical protein